MSTLIWPPVPIDSQADQVAATLARELDWLLNSIQETLQSLKAGLEECAELLASHEPGSTLVLSSLRSESLKGFITRVGTRITKGDIHLRLPSLPVPKGQNSFRLTVSSAATAPTIVLSQLSTARTLINGCLDIVDATRWTGDGTDANFIAGQLRLLHDDIQEAKAALKGWTREQRPWNEEIQDPHAFVPPLPGNVSLHLSISEAAVLLNVRTLESAHPSTGTNTPLSFTSGGGGGFGGFSIRDRLASALGAGRPAFHDEAHETFMYKGHEVRVRDKVRVESQDPSLMAALAKLGALERTVALTCRALSIVMGKDLEEDE